uniref:Uncharacterized protein n=1 Tax=Cucumis sativus TaxID=3659 RepID=A0A0A0K7R2_CUCSA
MSKATERERVATTYPILATSNIPVLWHISFPTKESQRRAVAPSQGSQFWKSKRNPMQNQPQQQKKILQQQGEKTIAFFIDFLKGLVKGSPPLTSHSQTPPLLCFVIDLR